MTEMYLRLVLPLSLFFLNELLQQEELAAPFCLCIRGP